MRITIDRVSSGGWKFAARLEPDLFDPRLPPIVARGRNLSEAVGALIFCAQAELNIKIEVLGPRKRAARQRSLENLPAA